MKTLFSILFFFTISLTFAQLTASNGSSSGSSGGSTGLTTGQYIAMGTNNGCRDGQRTAHFSSWQTTLNSIITNQAINSHYRNAYHEAFLQCRANELASGGTDQGDGATCTWWDWSSMGYVTGPCTDAGSGNVPNNGDTNGQE